MKVNKHGLEFVGLKKCSGDAVNWAAGSGCENQIFYNVETGEIWCVTKIGDTWQKFENDAILLIATTTRHATMQELADWAKDAHDQLDIVNGFYPWDLPF